ncbi:MAG: hypothetical protein AAFN81_27365, partial [Bacteroidota bacterium]
MRLIMLFLLSGFLAFSASAQATEGCGGSSGNGPRSGDECIIIGVDSLGIFQQGVYSVDLEAQCAECYDWDISGPGIIVGSDQNSSVTIESTGIGDIVLSVTVFTEDGCIECCIPITVPNPCREGCCFDFWVTPKWFPDCFTDCNGNLDNVVELHQEYCVPLPLGYTSYITDIEILGNATLGNCHNCENPITTFAPGSEPVPSVNLAVCGPLNHSVLVDITVYDPDGNPILVCNDIYYSFSIDECDDNPFPRLEGIGSTGDYELTVVYQQWDNQLNVSGVGVEDVRTVAISDAAGQLLQTIPVSVGTYTKLELPNVTLP